MKLLEKIEQLLINTGIPSQAMIDYIVDNTVHDMVEKVLIPNNEKLESSLDNIEPLFKENETLVVTNNALQIFCKMKDFETVFDMVKISLERYYPYLTIDDRSDPLSQIEKYKGSLSEEVDDMGFCLKLEITPQMKLHQKLQNNIEQKTNSKPKIKI